MADRPSAYGCGNADGLVQAQAARHLLPQLSELTGRDKEVTAKISTCD